MVEWDNFAKFMSGKLTTLSKCYPMTTNRTSNLPSSTKSAQINGCLSGLNWCASVLHAQNDVQYDGESGTHQLSRWFLSKRVSVTNAAVFEIQFQCNPVLIIKIL
jgi:hypothetical protein